MARCSLPADFGRTAVDYAVHRQGFPDRFYAAITGGWPAGAAVVDLGAGTATVGRRLAARGFQVTAVDRSGPMLAEAARLAAEEGLPLATRLAPAEATGLPDASVDVVVAAQCWHWFEGPAAAVEVRRVLRPGGELVIAHLDWLPVPGTLVADMEALILAFNPTWQMAGGLGMYPRWLAHLAEAGFESLETASFDTALCYSHEAWRGRVRASAGVGASLPPDRVRGFDRAHAALLAGWEQPDPLRVPHRVWWVRGVAP